MQKYKILSAIIIFAGIAAVSYAQVDRNELQQNLPQVTFINYEGPYAKIDTKEQIIQLGVVLGRQISAGEGRLAPTLAAMSAESRRTYTYKLEAGTIGRYFVIHCVSGQENGKIDADIFGLGVDTGVDHIRNLRWIIQGYLQNAYNYSEKDAFMLAEYITIYNAVYRGSWDYFSGRYKMQVMENLAKDKAGLSIRYDEWPGRTLMLIPLGSGGLSAVDTSTISDRRVVEELRKEDDRGVPQRQGMVELKEREAEQAERQAQVERQAIRQEENKNAQERQNIEQERQQTREDQEAGKISQEEAKEKQDELDKREQAVDEKDQELDQRRDEAQKLENFAEKKTDEAQQERQNIAKDQQSAISSPPEEGVIGVMISKETPTTMGRLLRISMTGTEMKRAALDSVHIRTLSMVGGKIIAIAGENTGNGAVRLIEIDQSSLEMAKQGDDDIMTGSLLWINASDLYAITVDLKSKFCYMGRFDTNLELKAKSALRVHPNAALTIQQGRLLTQDENGNALILDPADLTQK
ncbi:MAG: hypothetical protein LBV17_01740 [Treponema sp.]|jgi:hypothetical protein|nr:hypothetical protein [Treponema sp.]